MKQADLRSWLIRIAILGAAVLLTWGALMVGRLTEPIDLGVDDRAAQTFTAPRFLSIVDEEATEEARELAALNTQTIYRIEPEAQAATLQDINSFFVDLREVALPVQNQQDEAPPADTTTSQPTSTTEGDQATTTTSSITTSTTVPEPLPVEEQIAILRERHQLLDESTIETMVAIANAPDSGARNLEQLLAEAADVAEAVLQEGIRQEELTEARAEVLNNPPGVIVPLDIPVDPAAARLAVADVVSNALRVNEVRDDDATDDQRRLNREAVDPKTREFQFGEPIVRQGERVTAVELQALREAGLLQRPDGLGAMAMLVMVALLMAVLAFYLARFRPDFWARPKRVALFGLLIVLTAVATRGVALLLVPTSVSLGYLVPAAAFGFMAAVLFDARMAVLTAVAVGALTGLATFDPQAPTGSLGYTLFALLATLVPVPFVSAISARADLRRAVGYSGLAMAPMAGAIAWLFHGQEVAVEALGWGLVNALLSGFLAMGLLPFLETLFDITTALALLDLTDRNHPALQLLEERALGTFNHSLMVGTLADRGARAIDANPLLARAAAYFHDLGKTENPWFFIENQFGGTNPHDSMPPEESADIIRQHVIDGRRLAEEYQIPTEVAEGVSTHHGTGLMRYFYQKAAERYGEENVDQVRYRHKGHKPHTKEMTILMLADAVEGACRALVLHENPTPANIRRTIDKVVAEKLADGQLDQSALSLGELRSVKEAFAGALLGHYHQRIPYPNFPESPEDAAAWVVQGPRATDAALLEGTEEPEEAPAEPERARSEGLRGWLRAPGTDLPTITVVGGLVLMVTIWVVLSTL